MSHTKSTQKIHTKVILEIVPHKSNIRDSSILMELNTPLENHSLHKLARNTYMTVNRVETTRISSQV